MKQKICYSLITFFSGFISAAALAQLPQATPGERMPRQLYIEKYPGKVQPMEATKSFDYHILPLDNMVCAVPKISKPGINVVDPTKGAAYPCVPIPNALAMGLPVK